jgi:hypothetical protein
MQATSTPTLAQSKPSAYLALGMAALLALAVAIGAVVALAPLPVAAPTAGSATGIEQGIAAKNSAGAAAVSGKTTVDDIFTGAGQAPIVHSGGGWNPGKAAVPYPAPVYPPIALPGAATNVGDYFDARAGWTGSADERYTESVGISHR